jgi:hypoxanthine phosphoribosyltransferase
MLQIDDLSTPISKELITGAAEAVAEHLVGVYPNGCVICAILEGAGRFADELVSYLPKRTRHLYSFTSLWAKSYVGEDQKEKVEVSRLPSRLVFHKRHVVLVEDVIDSGKTVQTVGRLLIDNFKPKSVGVAAMCLKCDLPQWLHEEAVGFKLPSDKFIVGFGMDYNGKFRDLDVIRELAEDERQESTK